ncbi:hypothetical protein [Dactylosporangium sp. NPDC006015]|uniref:hypothetical protein n=1 Tax=Dactylosporangium sp. NPDC006015 TaxID=3154576 RepID=UPI0033AB110E
MTEPLIGNKCPRTFKRSNDPLFIRGAARLLDVHVGKAAVAGPAGGNHHVVDGAGQVPEAPFEEAGSVALKAAVCTTSSSVAAGARRSGSRPVRMTSARLAAGYP